MSESQDLVQWERVYIFISSTFNDMHAERDYLVKRVFPELQDWCERRKLRLVDIDLRWGVTEQDATHNKNVIKVCLNRIDDCRPFFLCFLGQRRGWVPSENEISPETFDYFPDLRSIVGAASVTEMEILHALIEPFHQSLPRDPSVPVEYYERAKHAFFYLRDPSYLDQVPNNPPMLRATYTNDWVEDPAERAAHDRALKRWREQEIPNANRPFLFYKAKWDSSAQTPELRLPLLCPSAEPANIERWQKQWQKAGVSVTGLNIEDDPVEASKAEAFNTGLSSGRLTDFNCEGSQLSAVIIEQLREAIATRFPRHVEVEGQDDLQEEIDQQERFVFVNSEGFIERQGDFVDLDNYVANDSNKLFVLTAPGGMGKTMLLANWVDRYRVRIEGNSDQSVYFRFIGASDRSTAVYSLLRFLLREMKEVSGNLHEEIPDDPIKLRQKWLESLNVIGRHGNTVIVIDALNQLETGLTDVSWLPQTLPKNIKLIVSFKRDDDASEELYRRWKDAQLFSEVKPFDDLDDRRRLVKAYLSRYLKELDEEHLRVLINSDGAGNPLFLKVVLSELRVFGAFANLAEKIRQDFGSSPVTAFQAVLNRLETDPVYSKIRSEEAVPMLFGLLAHARHGLSADELVDLLIQALELEDNEGSRETTADTVYLFLRQLRPFLAHRERRYDFFYESLKIAAQECFVAKSGEDHLPKRPAHEWHRYLARYLRRKTDPLNDGMWSGDYPRGLRDLPYHLLEGGLYEQLFQIARDESFFRSQSLAFLSEPQLPLETLQAAIEAAARSDNAVRMTEFILAHSQRLMDIRRESPLNAFRAGHLERARQIADLYEIERCVLWYLLLSWVCECAGRREEARANLQHLRENDLPHLSFGWEADYVVVLLALVRDVSEESLLDLQARLLGDHYQQLLCERLADLGSPIAVNVARTIEAASTRGAALKAVGQSQFKAGSPEAGREMFAEAVEAARGIESADARAEALKSIARMQAEAGEFDDAFSTASEIDTQFGRESATAAVAAVLARGGDLAAALQAIQNVSKERRDEALASIAEVQTRAGDFAAAVETALGIDVAMPRAAAIEMIALAQAEAGELSSAIRTAEEIDGFWGRLRLYVTDGALEAIAKAEARVGHFSSALQAAGSLGQMIRRDDTLREIAEAQARAGDSSGSLETARMIQYEHTRTGALKTIAGCYARAGDFESALHIINGLTEPARAEAIAAIAEEQARAGDFACALETTQQLDEPKRAPLMGIIAALQAEGGNRNAAHETFRRAQDLSRTIIDERGRAEVLASIAVSQARAGWRDPANSNLAEAFSIGRQIGDETRRAETLLAIVCACVKTGDTATATNVVSFIDKSWYLAEGLKEIAQTQAASGERELARATFNRAFEASMRMTGGWANPGAIIEAAARAGEFETALRAARTIPNEQQRCEGLSAVAKALALARETAAAWAIIHEIDREKEAGEALSAVVSAQARAGNFAEAIAIAHSVSGERQRSKALEAVVTVQAEGGEYNAALETARLIEPDWAWADALVKVATALAKAGRLSEAMGIRDEIEQEKLRADAYAAAGATDSSVKVRLPKDKDLRDRRLKAVAAVQARAGAFSEALRTAREIKFDWTRSEAMRAISEAQAHAGDFAVARETADWISRDVERVATMKAIAMSLMEAGEREAAKATFADAAAGAAAISDGYHKNEALKDLVRLQAEAGEFDDATRTAYLIESDDSRFPALANVAEKEAAAGYIEAAHLTITIPLTATTREPETERWRAAALATVAKYQAQSGESDAAVRLAEQIGDDQWEYEAFKSIGVAQAKAGMRDRARQSFEAGMMRARRADDGWWKWNKFRRLAEAQLEAGDLASALNTALSIPRRDEVERHDALVATARAYARGGDFAGAFRIVDSIDSSDSTWQALAMARCLAAIAGAQAASGNRAAARSTFDAALKGAREMGGDGWRMKAVRAVAEAQAEIGEVDPLEEIARATINTKSLRAEALAAIGEAHARIGNHAAARSSFAAALEVARGIDVREERDQGDRLAALMSVAAAQARAGDSDAALRVAQELKQQVFLIQLLGEIVMAQASRGQFDAALNTAGLMEEGWQKAKALRDVAVAQAQAGLGSQSVQTSLTIVEDRGSQLHQIAEALAEVGDLDSFKRLLIPCSFYPEAAYRVCGLLARFYPAAATTVAALVNETD